MRKKGFKSVVNLLSLLLVFIASYFSVYSGILGVWDYIVTDHIYQRPDSISNQIKIIAIDEKTLIKYGNPSEWSRQIYADLINHLSSDSSHRPDVIAFDITYFGNSSDSNGDLTFAEACKNSGNVVVASNIVFKNDVKYNNENEPYIDNLNIENIQYPYDELNKYVNSGFTNSLQDTDNYIRRSFLYFEYNNSKVYNFPFTIYSEYMNAKGKTPVVPDTDNNNCFGIKFSAKPESRYEVFSMSDVLDGKYDPEIFKDSIVLVGAYAAGMQDSYLVPVSHGFQMYGVEIHANIIDSLIKETTTVPADLILVSFITGIASVLFLILNRRFKVINSFLFMLAAIIIHIAICIILYRLGIYAGVLTLPVIITLIFLINLIIKYIFETVQKKQLIIAFKKYISPYVVDELVAKGDFEIKLDGEVRDIAVLFADIRNFTSISEGMKPENVVEILNDYLSLITEAVFKNNGTLDKFIGDCAMAVFNAPFDQDDYEYQSVCTACDIINHISSFQNKLNDKYGISVQCGIGIHCGKAVIGNIGSDIRIDYTAIGDTVNTASRIESLAHENQILISEDLYKRVESKIYAENIGQYLLKGKSKTLTLYSVTGIKK